MEAFSKLREIKDGTLDVKTTELISITAAGSQLHRTDNSEEIMKG